MDISVFLDNISLKMTQGRKSKNKKRKTEESQAPAAQDEPQSPEVSEEPGVTEEQPEASQEMPPPRLPPSPPKEDEKRGRRWQALSSQIKCCMQNQVLWSNDKKYAFQKKQKW